MFDYRQPGLGQLDPVIILMLYLGHCLGPSSPSDTLPGLLKIAADFMVTAILLSSPKCPRPFVMCFLVTGPVHDPPHVLLTAVIVKKSSVLFPR